MRRAFAVLRSVGAALIVSLLPAVAHEGSMPFEPPDVFSDPRCAAFADGFLVKGTREPPEQWWSNYSQASFDIWRSPRSIVSSGPISWSESAGLARLGFGVSSAIDRALQDPWIVVHLWVGPSSPAGKIAPHRRFMILGPTSAKEEGSRWPTPMTGRIYSGVQSRADARFRLSCGRFSNSSGDFRIVLEAVSDVAKPWSASVHFSPPGRRGFASIFGRGTLGPYLTSFTLAANDEHEAVKILQWLYALHSVTP